MSVPNEELEHLAKEWHDAELKIRPLQPFEDYYKSIRAFVAGYQAAQAPKPATPSEAEIDAASVKWGQELVRYAPGGDVTNDDLGGEFGFFAGAVWLKSKLESGEGV